MKTLVPLVNAILCKLRVQCRGKPNSPHYIGYGSQLTAAAASFPIAVSPPDGVVVVVVASLRLHNECTNIVVEEVVGRWRYSLGVAGSRLCSQIPTIYFLFIILPWVELFSSYSGL